MYQFYEIVNVLYKNRHKGIIAGITVAWGVMLLILLVGTGKGLQNGVKKMFSSYTIKTIEVFAGEASISDLGVSKGEFINFNELDIKNITTSLSATKHLSPVVRVQIPKIYSERKSTNRFSLLGVSENYFKIKTLPIEKGRLFNSNDNNRKVIIIGYDIAKNLFNNTNCIGRILFLKNNGYKIIGVIKKDTFFNDSGNNIYIPYQDALHFNNSLNFDEFILSLQKNTDSEEFQKTLQRLLSKKKGLNVNDKTVLYFNNIENTLKSFNTLFNAINIFLWFIGISFLVSGMLGVFNIMTVIVKDRIGEFGIRKAVGASPKSIQVMVLVEALIITLLSGIVGLLIGFGIIYLINLYILISKGSENFIILDINLYVILFALILLVLSGCVAGIIPARKASKVLPIQALREINN